MTIKEKSRALITVLMGLPPDFASSPGSPPAPGLFGFNGVLRRIYGKGVPGGKKKICRRAAALRPPLMVIFVEKEAEGAA
jgi:hypothetical protein